MNEEKDPKEILRLAALSALSAGLLITPATAFSQGDAYDDDATEYEAFEGTHEEEWYDPSDWFDDEYQANEDGLDVENEYEADWDSEVWTDDLEGDRQAGMGDENRNEARSGSAWENTDDAANRQQDRQARGSENTRSARGENERARREAGVSGVEDGRPMGTDRMEQMRAEEEWGVILIATPANMETREDQQRRNRGQEASQQRSGDAQTMEDRQQRNTRGEIQQARFSGTLDGFKQMRLADSGNQDRMQGSMQDRERGDRQQRNNASMRDRQGMSQATEYTIAKVDLDDGRTTAVNLGETKQVRDLNLQKGDEVTITGTLGQIGDQRVFVAQRLGHEGKTTSVNGAFLRRQYGSDSNKSWNSDQEESWNSDNEQGANWNNEARSADDEEYSWNKEEKNQRDASSQRQGSQNRQRNQSGIAAGASVGSAGQAGDNEPTVEVTEPRFNNQSQRNANTQDRGNRFGGIEGDRNLNNNAEQAADAVTLPESESELPRQKEGQWVTETRWEEAEDTDASADVEGDTNDGRAATSLSRNGRLQRGANRDADTSASDRASNQNNADIVSRHGETGVSNTNPKTSVSNSGSESGERNASTRSNNARNQRNNVGGSEREDYSDNVNVRINDITNDESSSDYNWTAESGEVEDEQ